MADENILNVPITNEPLESDVEQLQLKEIAINKEIIKHLENIETMYSAVLSPYKSRLNDFLNLYRCKPTRKYHKKAKANVFVPEFFRAVETLATQIYQILFSEDPFFSVEGREFQDIQQSKILEAMIDYQTNEMEFKRKVLSLLRSLLINGVVVVEHGWKNEQRRITKKVKETNETGAEVINEVEENIDIADRPEFENVDLLDLYIDPNVTNIKEAEWVMIQQKFTYTKLKAWEKAGFISNVEELKGREKKSSSKTDSLKEKRLKDAGFDPSGTAKKEFTVYLFWGKIKKKWLDASLDETDEGEEEIEGRVIACLDVILKKSENPFWHQEKPFISCSLFEIFNEFFAMGLGQICESPSYELNDTHNQILDHKTLSIYHMLLKGKASGLKRKDFKIEPEKVIDCEDITQVRELRPDPTAMSQAVQVESIIRKDIQDASAPATIQGIKVQGTITATESGQIYGEGANRVRTLAMSIAEQLIKPLLQKFYQLNQQYMTTKKIVRIIGIKGFEYLTVKPSDVIGNYDFIPKVMTDIQNRVSIRQNLVNMLGMLAKLPTGLVPMESIYKLTKKIYEYHNMKDSDDIFPPLPDRQMADEEGAIDETEANIGGGVGPKGTTGQIPAIEKLIRKGGVV